MGTQKNREKRNGKSKSISTRKKLLSNCCFKHDNNGRFMKKIPQISIEQQTNMNQIYGSLIKTKEMIISNDILNNNYGDISWPEIHELIESNHEDTVDLRKKYELLVEKAHNEFLADCELSNIIKDLIIKLKPSTARFNKNDEDFIFTADLIL